MPALYRMPITYVVLLLVGAAYAARATLSGGGGRPATAPGPFSAPPSSAPPAEAPPTTAEAPLAAAEPATVPTPPRPPDPPATDPILRTTDGLRRKVVVTDLGAALRPTPGGAPGGTPLDYLAIRHVFEETPAAFRVGKGESPEGWLARSSVLEWDTRLMVRPTMRAGRARLVLYADEACAGAAASGRECGNHGPNCPTSGEEPDSADAASAPEALLGWPVLATRRAPGPDVDLYEVASLVDARAAVPTGPPPELRPALGTVQVAFVVDTTASMQATIDSVREVARKLTNQAGRDYADVTLRLGLVSYRDVSPSFGYVAKVDSMFAPPARFLEALDALEAAKKGDGSVDEAVFDGLTLALPGGRNHLDWPTGETGALVTKLLILLGDAPDHAKDLVRARRLAESARNAGITIAAVALRPSTPLTRSERGRYESQWRTLAEESYRPPDRNAGFARPIPPQSPTLEEVSGLSRALGLMIAARIEAARARAAIAAAEAEGRLENYVNSQGLTTDQVAPVLRDLRRIGDPAARTNPTADGKKAPAVRRGWIAGRIGGKPTVTLEMLLGRDEIDALIREFNAALRAARASADGLNRLVELGNAAAAGETLFLNRDQGTRTFADHLKRRQGVAPVRKDSLLSRSRTDLLRSDAALRSELDRRLGASIENLVRRRAAPDWRTPGRTFEGKALVPFAWIDF